MNDTPLEPQGEQVDAKETISAAEKGAWREASWSPWNMIFGPIRALGRAFLNRPILTFILSAFVVGGMYVERNFVQPFALTGRIYLGSLLTVLIVMSLAWMIVRKRSARWRAFVSLLACGAGVAIVVLGKEVNHYITSYWRYETLKIVDLQTLPITDYERILPLNSVHTLVNERINETEVATPPNMVRTGDRYEWTSAIAPTYFVQRFLGKVQEVVHLPATSASPELSKKHRDGVSFTAGEQLPFSRNATTCTRRSFGLWRFLNYEPGNILFMKDDAGKWVQVVTLIKWEGIFFPWPEFGGVQVIRQSDHDYSWEAALDFIPYILKGCGEWIPPEEIGKHEFLKGQNVMPYAVSRFMAKSLRFQEGFLGPLPGNRVGDLRIADLPDDMNQQPFTLYFNMKKGEAGKLYQYFALEPYDTGKQGLSTSFFVSADGVGPQYAYRHFKHGESAIGVSAVADYVRNSKKNYDWTQNTPVEHRPYIRVLPDVNGVSKERFFWMTTVVTQKQKGGSTATGVVSGTVPEIAITDIHRSTVVWVNALEPQKWPEELQKALGSIWARE